MNEHLIERQLELATSESRKKFAKKRKAKPVSFREYLAWPGVHFSSLKIMRESPAHYRHSVDVGREDTAALIRLRAVHTAVLEPEKFDLLYPVFMGPRRQGEAWEAFKLVHEGKEILKLDERDLIMRQAAAIKAHPVAAEYLARSQCEISFKWKDKATGLACKGRADLLFDGGLGDLKAGTTNARVFGSLAAKMGYHNQAAFYRSAARAAGHTIEKSILIVYEPKEPHDVAVFTLRADDVDRAEEENTQLLIKVAEHQQLGRWPGRVPVETVLDLPSWIYGDDEEFTEGGAFAEGDQ